MNDKKPDDLRRVKFLGVSILQWMGIIILASTVAILVHEYL